MSALLHRGQAKPGVLPQEKGESMETIGYEELEVFFQGAADIFREKKEGLCGTPRDYQGKRRAGKYR